MTRGKAKAGSGTPWIVRQRTMLQAAFALLWLSPFLRIHSVCGPVFHCYSCPLAAFSCPIGALANFSALHVFPFIAVGTLLLVGALFGSLVCGYACPFGLFQDLLGKIPTPKFRLPAWTGYTRYAVLGGLVLAVPYLWGEASPLFFCRLCPAGALEAALPHTASLAIAGEPVVWPSALKLSILGMLLVGALFVWRPWCTLFCPLGAIFSGMNRVAMVYVDFHESECNDCDVCRKRCNYGGADRRAADNRCVRCLECVGCRALTVGTIFGHRRPSATGSASAPLRLPKALAVGRHRPPPAGAAKRWEAIAVWLRDLLRRPTAAPHRLRQAVPRSDSECDRELVTIQQFTGTAPSVSAEPEKTGLSTQEGAKNGPVPRPDETTPVA